MPAAASAGEATSPPRRAAEAVRCPATLTPPALSSSSAVVSNDGAMVLTDARVLRCCIMS